MTGEETNTLQSTATAAVNAPAWEWEDSDGEDVTLENESDDNDDVCSFKDEQTDSYDDINWEEGAVDGNNSHPDQVDDDIDHGSSKRMRLHEQSDNNQTNTTSSLHIHFNSSSAECKYDSSSVAGSLINQLGCAPYAMEITFCTDVQTSDNTILLNQAKEIAQALIKFSLPKLMIWIDILTQSMEHLLQRSDKYSNSTSRVENNDSNINSFRFKNDVSRTEPIILFKFTHELARVADLLKTIFLIQTDIQRLVYGQYKDLLIEQ